MLGPNVNLVEIRRLVSDIGVRDREKRLKVLSLLTDISFMLETPIAARQFLGAVLEADGPDDLYCLAGRMELRQGIDRGKAVSLLRELKGF